LGDKLLGKVMADDLRGYRLWLERKELEPKTVCNILTDARCLFSWAVDAGLVDTSPVPRRLLPKLQERPPDRLTEEEAERLAVLPEPFGFTIRLGLGTGLRWSELCRAEAAHIERGALVVSETKSRRVRRVPLPPELLREVGSRIGRLVPFDPMQPSNFSAVVRRLSGIEGFHSHQMRHTFACRWLERGGSLAALQQVLGHASVATTQQYARLSDEAVRHEADRLWAQKP
jgi:integrase